MRRLVDPQGLAGRLRRAHSGTTWSSCRRSWTSILTLAAEGRLRVKLHVPDAGEGRRARNRTVSLVASLVALVGVAFLVRHVAPAYGPEVERVGAVLLLIVGGWLLMAAARL